jgi:hypothetical protein
MRKIAAGKAIAAVALCAAVSGVSAEVISGLEVGAPTQSIPVMDVTGTYKGRLICYVCDFQDDPNVLAFFRSTGEETAQLIRELNQLYLTNRDDNFKAVAMVVAGAEAKDWLAELAEAEHIEIPLTYLRRGPQDVAVRLYELNSDVENTFLVTVNRFVTANVSDIEPGEFGLVADAAAQMLLHNTSKAE